jgi:hypothetical protein
LDSIGTDSTSWIVTASIRELTGHPDAVLTGTTTATFTDSIAKFTDLAITHHGNGYILDFNLTSPALAVLQTVATSPKKVPKRDLKLTLYLPPKALNEGEIIGLKVLITDKNSAVLPDLTWRVSRVNTTGAFYVMHSYLVINN